MTAMNKQMISFVSTTGPQESTCLTAALLKYVLPFFYSNSSKVLQ